MPARVIVSNPTAVARLNTEQVAPYYGCGDELHLSFNFPPLFGHQYSHCWVDFRGIWDEFDSTFIAEALHVHGEDELFSGPCGI